MTGFTVKVEGLEEVTRRLNALPHNLANNAMRRSLSAGARVIRDLARANAKKFDDPNTQAAIWQNIVVNKASRKREKAAGGIMQRVGVIGGARSGKKVAYTNNKTNRKLGIVGQEYSVFHWRYLEFGTSEMRAQPFMRPAMYAGATGAFNAIAGSMEKEIDKELANLP